MLKEPQSSPSHVIKIKSLMKFVSVETAVLVTQLWVKYLLHKHEVLDSDPQHPHKKLSMVIKLTDMG